MACSRENEHVEEVSAQEGTTFTHGLATAAEDTVGANRSVERLINYEDLKHNIEASQSVVEESNTENAIIPEEPEEPASKVSNAATNSEQPVILDEPKVTEPAVGSTEDTAANGVTEQSKEELMVADTATDA
jgi:hypothetical protein